VLAGAPAEGNIFYHLCPAPLLLPLVLLATVATVIASQAVITGAFSMTRQWLLWAARKLIYTALTVVIGLRVGTGTLSLRTGTLYLRIMPSPKGQYLHTPRRGSRWLWRGCGGASPS
jgi:hypothetical protein